MPSLKDLKVRIESVKSTRKITSAMKMVAASKLRRAQEAVEASRPYATKMAAMLRALASGLNLSDTGLPPLLVGTGGDKVNLLIVISSDRGLCGAFNGSIVREARRQIRALQRDDKTVKILVVGRKARDLLKREFAELIVASLDDVGKPKLSYADAERVTAAVLELFNAGEFDRAFVVYNRFKSAISQIVTVDQVIPAALPASEDAPKANEETLVYEFEPNEAEILADLMPKNLAVQVYRALLESSASEQGARMTAMDNATRNAGDMINRLTLTYNRTRQAAITKELIEIISGAEAV